MRKLTVDAKVYVPKAQPEPEPDAEADGRTRPFSVRLPNSDPHTVRAQPRAAALRAAVGDTFGVDARKFRFLGGGKPLNNVRALDEDVPVNVALAIH